MPGVLVSKVPFSEKPQQTSFQMLSGRVAVFLTLPIVLRENPVSAMISRILTPLSSESSICCLTSWVILVFVFPVLRLLSVLTLFVTSSRCEGLTQSRWWHLWSFSIPGGGSFTSPQWTGMYFLLRLMRPYPSRSFSPSQMRQGVSYPRSSFLTLARMRSLTSSTRLFGYLLTSSHHHGLPSVGNVQGNSG